jgi:hypothetical protein
MDFFWISVTKDAGLKFKNGGRFLQTWKRIKKPNSLIHLSAKRMAIGRLLA